MSTKFQKNLRNDLNQYDSDYRSESAFSKEQEEKGFTLPKFILLVAFLSVFGFYITSQFSFSDDVAAPVENIFSSLDEPSDELLAGMGSWMTDMGYGELSRAELIELRRAGVTATNTSELRDLGYTDLSLDDLKELGRANVDASYVEDLQNIGYSNLTVEQMIDMQKADVSVTFASMMKSLGYDLTPEDLAQLRSSGVTAFFTSNMNDLGYENISKEDLIRMRSIGVTHEMVEDLIEARGNTPTIDEIVRYRISNQ